jgi:hypothetical protein
LKDLLRSAPLAILSLVCVALGWLFFGAFVVSGVNHRLGSSMDKVGQFTVASPCLIAIVLALASVIWNPGKAPGLVALIVAVLATWGLLALGG